MAENDDEKRILDSSDDVEKQGVPERDFDVDGGLADPEALVDVEAQARDGEQTKADSETDILQDTKQDATAEPEQSAGTPADKKKKALAVIKRFCKRYFIDAFTGMAQGLFCTLIAGTIIGQIASWCGDNAFATVLGYFASFAKSLMGAGIGVGIAHKLGAKPLVIFTAAVTGLIGAFSGNMVSALAGQGAFTFVFGAPGNPIGSYIVATLTVEIAGLYAGKTKLDIVLVPLGMMAMSMAFIFVAWPFIKLIDLIARALVLLVEAGAAVKALTGVVVAIVMGILLTMPTSSAAIWIAIATSDVALANPEAFSIAGGAAVAGCAAHMIGFAFATVRENGVSGLISQGIGTSMLQIPNIMKKPIIMLPEVVASAVGGLTAVLIGLRCDATGGGMGTSGLVGVFGAISASLDAGVATWRIVLGVILCLFVLPALVSVAVDLLLRKVGAVRPSDVKLPD